MIALTLRVLIVDDDKVQCETLAKLIRNKIAPAEVEVLFSHTLEEGVRMSHEAIPCIVLLDLVFPDECDWKATALSICRFRKESAVVVVSELDFPEVDFECRKCGAVATFPKRSIRSLIEILVYVISNVRLNNLAREGTHHGRR